MPVIRLPLGPWLPDAGEQNNPGLLIAVNFFPYGNSYVPNGLRLDRTATLPGIDNSVPAAALTGRHVNPNVDAVAEVDADLILGHGTLYYGIGQGATTGEIFAVDVAMHEDALWAVTNVTTPTTYNVGKEGWHFASFGSTEIAVCGHAEHVLIRVDGIGLFVKCFDTVLDPDTGEPKPKFVAVGDERLIFANIANTAAPGPGTPDPNVNLVWWGATDSPRSIGNESTHPIDATGFQLLIDDHGPITGMVGGREFALIFKRDTIYRMDYGGPWGPTFKPIPQAFGCRHSQSIIRVGDVIYFWGPNGPARYNLDHVEDMGVGVFSRTITDENWIVGGPNIIYQDFLDPAGDNLSEAYTVQVAYSSASGNVVWVYREVLNGHTRLLVWNHWSERASVIQRARVINSVNGTGDSAVLGLVSMPETGIGFAPARDILFFETERNLDTAKIFTLGDSGAESHNHALRLGTGYFGDPKEPNRDIIINRIRPVYTVAAGELAPMVEGEIDSKLFSYDTSPVTICETATDRTGWIMFSAVPRRPLHKITIIFPVTDFATHPARVLAEIDAVEVEYSLAGSK